MNNNNMGFNNKAWGRSNDSPSMLNQRSMPPQLMNQGTLGNMGSTMVQFPANQQVFQNMGLQGQNLGLGLQQIANNAMNAAASLNPQIANNPLFQQVSYPNTRGLNPTAFQTNLPSMPSAQNNATSGTKQRVFTGKVTQMHDNFGLVDEEVIFQTSVCVKGSHPIVGDRVLVEASYTPTMHFKWSATRVQVLSTNVQPRHSNNKTYGNSGNYNAVPPPEGRDNRKGGGNRGRERPRDNRDRDDDEIDRKRRRDERMREREKEEKKSPVRKRTRSRSRSPKNRRRMRVVPRYNVQIPKIALDLSEGDVLEIRRRYTNIYVPSDFFNTSIRWVESFPPDKPFTLNKPCSFHVMHKDIDAIAENNAVLDPPDADYLFSAKVMLMSVPGLDEIYRRCCVMAEDKDGGAAEKDLVHPSRLVNFLVGLRGKNETMAIGGPWSRSVDGDRPGEDPSVLIRTAIRTCKGLTGIDLSNCTQWYRFVELNYRRGESSHKGKLVPARVETVVIFLPDVWSCLPTRLEWDGAQAAYRRRLDNILSVSGGQQQHEKGGSDHGAEADVSMADEKDENAEEKLVPTPYAQLDVKSMTVNDLRNELRARGISNKGLKSQLVARLTKALKAEAEKDEDSEKGEEEGEGADVEMEGEKQEDKKIEVEEKKLDERERALLEKRHTLPEQPHIIVHPSKTAKSGKFDCTVMSLSLLLDYRPEDTKEHSFEVSLFAELFNEMLIRDFGFNIYKALYELPEKKDEKKEKDGKKEKEDKKDDEKKDKEEEGTGKEEDKVEGDKEAEGDKDKEKSVEESKVEVKRSNSKERKPSSGEKRDRAKRDDDTGDDDDSEEDDSAKRDRRNSGNKETRALAKKKERAKRVTKDRHLLLSFVYFDQTHCGYIFDKDIEDLFFTLGLKLSRAQVKKMVSRDTLYYRKLTDKLKEEETDVAASSSEATEDVTEEEEMERTKKLAQGNKWMLPSFKGSGGNRGQVDQEGGNALQDGFVKYRGSLVDIGKLMSQLDRSEKTRLETETRMVDLKHDNQKLNDKYAKTSSTIKHLSSELKDYKDKLRNTEETLQKTTAHSKLYQQTLADIRDKIDPVLKITIHKEEAPTNHVKKEKDDKEKDRKVEDGKSRWEKDRDTKEGSVKKEELLDAEMAEVKKEKDS